MPPFTQRSKINLTEMIMKLSDRSLIKTASYINGAWRDADSSFALNNPATGEKLADIADHGADAVREAIDAAAAAQKEWAARHRQGPRHADAGLVQSGHGKSGRSGADHHRRDGQAAG